MRGILLFVALLAAAPDLARALPETPQFRPVGVADGLPSSSTFALALDRDGYLWIATRDGLVRYDGVSYRVYQHVPGDLGGLPGNFIQTVFVDRDNRVWVGVEGHGFSVLDAQRRGFRHFDRSTRALLLSDDIWAIQQTPDGAMWFASFGGGLYRMDAKESLTRFLPVAGDATSLPSPDVLSLALDARGQLWAGTTDGLARWTGRNFERLGANRLSGPTVLNISAEADGSLWIGTDGGLDLRRPDGRIERPTWRDQLPDAGVTSVVRDREGARWITTRKGIVVERNGVLDLLRDTVAGTRGAWITLEDREGGLWFATQGDGLLRLSGGWRHFAVFAKGEGDRGVRMNVRGMAPAQDGRVWLVGAGMVDRLDPRTGHVEHWFDTSKALPDGRLGSVIERADGSLWIGHSRGLTRMDPATRSMRHWKIGDGPEDLLQGSVRLMAETRDGLLWTASYGGGLQARDHQGRRVYSFVPGDGHGVDSPEQEQLAVGPDEALWIAGPRGLRRWNAAAARFDSIPGVPDSHVKGFAFVPPDILWMHREESLEAYRWDGRALTRIRSVGTDAGMPAVESGGMFVDRSGAIWLTTTRGLLRYDPVGNRLRVFGMRDGLPSQEFTADPPLLLERGWGLASTNAGLLLFDPARIHATGGPPRLTLDSVRLHRDEDLVQLDPDAVKLVMQPDDRDLQVTARLLSFADPAAHRYRYRLHGYDADWVTVGSLGERDFSRLEPGNYRMEVKASNADGVWSQSQGFQLQVLAPWWRRPLSLGAWAMLSLLLLVVGGWVYRQRLRLRNADSLSQHRRALSDQGSEAKTRFLAMLGHEIRTPMTGVLGMAELLQGSELGPRQRLQVDAIQRAGEHLLRLVNDALDLARIESGKLSLEDKPFDLHVLLDELSALLQALAQAKGLHFSLQRAPGTPRVLRGDVGRVRQVLLNLGSNAIKFTDAGEVALRSAGTPGGLLLEISDTGPGMSPDQVARLFQRFEQGDGLRASQRQAGSGLGLAICQELAIAMHGRIDVQSQLGQGTCFRMTLPLPAADVDDLLPVLARREPRPRAGLRLLVVEDDDTIAAVITGLLASLGHEPVHAAQGLAALTELAQSRFDLAFLDLDLPGLDGFELARIIRSQGHTLAMVALTARTDAQAEALSLAAGMHGFLRKPVTSQLLQDKIDQVLALIRTGEQPKHS